jgi:LysM repeat protein
VVERVCPLLALAADHRSVVDGVDAAHRCHAGATPEAVDRQVQSQLCLTPSHPRCDRYRQHVAQRGGASPGRLAVADGFVSTRPLLSPEPAWRGIAGRARRPHSGAVLLIAIVAVGGAGAAVAAALATGGLDLSADRGMLPAASVATASPSAVPSVTPRPRPTATATPTVATPEPTVAPTPEATPVATVVPTPTPPPPPVQTYAVQAGDTLAELAVRFGTSVEVLQALNGIDDPDEIVIGQILVLP